ncbi:MAG: hypothetical protein K2X55_10485 [Burkholderiaceae bacterium]|nr:hypothetical protein [Burkholderiaceae bacterium]
MRDALKVNPAIFPHEIDIVHLLKEVPDRKFVVPAPDGEESLHPSLLACLGQDGERRFFSQIGGNAHYFLGLFKHKKPFDFVLPEMPDMALEDGAEILPYEYMLEVMHENCEPNLAVLRALRRALKGPITHIESPPAIGDNDYCQNNLPPVFSTEYYKAFTVANPGFRKKMWRVHSEVFRRECARIGVDFLPCPVQSMDAQGFLRPEYYSDPLHGNGLYGELVLKQIEDRLAQEPGEIFNG